MHSFHLEVSKLLKEFIITYLSSGSLLTKPGQALFFSKGFPIQLPSRNGYFSCMQSCNWAYLEKEPNTRAVCWFLWSDRSLELSMVFRTNGSHGVLGPKAFRCTDVVFCSLLYVLKERPNWKWAVLYYEENHVLHLISMWSRTLPETKCK